MTHSSASAFPQTLFCLELSSTSRGGVGLGPAILPYKSWCPEQSLDGVGRCVGDFSPWIPPSRHRALAYNLLLKEASTLQPFHWSFLLNNEDYLGNEGCKNSTEQKPTWCYNSSHVRRRSSWLSFQTWLLSVKGFLLWNRGGLLEPSGRRWSPCAQACSHSAELYMSYSQSSDSQGHQNRSDVGIFHNANHQPQYFFSSIQSLSFLLEVVTNRQ